MPDGWRDMEGLMTGIEGVLRQAAVRKTDPVAAAEYCVEVAELYAAACTAYGRALVAGECSRLASIQALVERVAEQPDAAERRVLTVLDEHEASDALEVARDAVSRAQAQRASALRNVLVARVRPEEG